MNLTLRHGADKSYNDAPADLHLCLIHIVQLYHHFVEPLKECRCKVNTYILLSELKVVLEE